ncbi:hypothetical protein ANO14919_123460 [Xylariales sp. No.14919]|nr:hypothetical protein ANO14919_123460 [Xylariales sp. No.14919]
MAAAIITPASSWEPASGLERMQLVRKVEQLDSVRENMPSKLLAWENVGQAGREM